MCRWPMSVMTGDDGWGHALSQVPSGNVHSIHIVEDISLIGRFIDIMSSLTDIFLENISANRASLRPLSKLV